MSDSAPQPPAAPRRLIALAATVTGMFTVAGFAAMWLLSPRVPYADTWRFLDRFLTEPFPADVLAADNGHREVLPNLVRVAELQWLDANQQLQIVVGIALALLLVTLAWRTIRVLPQGIRGAATVVGAAGVFWLGNGRKLAHGSESLHLFAVLCCLVAGLRALTAARPHHTADVAKAAGFALLATFCFGSGTACFPAFVVVAVLQRRPPRQLLPLLAAALLALPGLLVGGDGTWPTEWAPLRAVDLLLRLLGAPSVWAFSPLLDPAHAARMPGEWLPELAGALAVPAHAAFGPPLSARWPAFAFGAAGVVWLLVSSWRTWRRGRHPVGVVGVGLAWFAVACASMVVVLRLDYFATYPEQITTQRYVPWSMLLWTGLLLAHVANRTQPRPALLAALVFALVLLPSSIWTARYAWKQRATAEVTAVGAAVGVLAADHPLEETVAAELRAVVPKLRAARAAMFAWPEVAHIGRPLPAAAPHATLHDVVVEPCTNLFGEPGCAVVLRASGVTGSHLLVAGADGITRGIVVRVPFDRVWRGWLAGSLPSGELTAASVRATR